MRDSAVPTLALLFLAGLGCTLGVPAPRGSALTSSAGAASGPEAAFATLVAGHADAGTGLAPEIRQHMLGTMRSLGPQPLARFLDQTVGPASSEAPRLAGLECLAGCATGREVVALVRLASPAGAVPSARLLGAFRAALLETLARDTRAFDQLVPAWRSAGAELRAELLATVAERGDPAGLALLAWVTTFEGVEYERALAEACLPLAPRARTAEDRHQLDTLCVLLDSQDGVCVQTISIALVRGRVEAAIPTWIDLLESESRGTRERARRSLEELTGLTLGATGERWRAWLEAEGKWFEEQAALVLAQLESDDDARVLTALREISRHRLHRDELAEAVAVLLEHPTPAVRLHTCSVLQGLASPLVVPALAAALRDEDQTVARCAWSTLRQLTGLDLPLDEELWRDHVVGS